jgi:hypothetical protein
MHKAQRTDAYFLGELNKFIQAAENQAKNTKTQRIPCPVQNMQKYESIQRHNYNQIVCVGGWFC